MHTCKPNCQTYEKKIETIQYRGSHPDSYSHIRRKHKLGDETEFFKAEIEISKEPYEKFVEQPIYTWEDLISDIGGTVGLFLGLSITELAFGFLDTLGRAATRTWWILSCKFQVRSGQSLSVKHVQLSPYITLGKEKI
ncbi:Oidioi.mRNA.OKI2018_I69.PAR.g9418.t1.cds [Oikopleura dioica]|uniref:Oidioi.mRNA.OKI2018_I69.PAR.g9418.t1.cds n=1 Tax=Oikopleura dioica TaxID=34765 RepID=A0ABN7RT13_OIKDI|nr:Oidioi.mRNA.OKI2018_I69.PAR.g9418.t1.cds [Oikopleura dioica]